MGLSKCKVQILLRHSRTNLLICSALDDLSKYAYRETRKSGLDSLLLGKDWMLGSSMSSYSEPHIDAAGYCTSVNIQAGSKLWLLQCANTETVPSTNIPKPGASWEIENSGWCAAHLCPGDYLYVSDRWTGYRDLFRQRHRGRLLRR